MKPVSIGIIGFGRIGAEHAAWLSQCPSAKPVAVADATPARQALAKERGLLVYSSFEALLADGQLDAILIATPTAMHFEHASAALSAGRHVMIEKPMALDLAQSQKLVHLAHEKQRLVSVFHNRRWDTDYLTVKHNIAAGAFGKVINIESRLGQWSSCVGPAAREYRPNWRNEGSFGGGGLYDWGSHFVDQIWRLVWPAKPVRVFAQLRGNVWSTDCDDFARLCIDFDNGAVALVEINTTTTRPLPRWHIDGTSGSADSPHSLAFDVEEWATLQFTPAEGETTPRLLPRAGGRMTEIDIWTRFASAIRDGREPAVKAASVLPTMALLDAARESSRTGRAVDVASVVEWVY